MDLKQFPHSWFGLTTILVQKFYLYRCTEGSFSSHLYSSRQLDSSSTVDGIVITGDVTLCDLKLYLQHKSQTKNLRCLRYFLGIDIARSKRVSFSSRGNLDICWHVAI